VSHQGKRVFIWNWALTEGGNAQRIAAKCCEYGVRGVVLKSADGGHPFGPFWSEERGKWIVQELLRNGVDVWLWQFVYGRAGVIYDDQKLGWEAEATQAIRALTVLGATGYMSDVEGEFESLDDRAGEIAEAYCRRIEQGAPGKPHYWCPLAQPSYHRMDVYDAFHRHVAAAFPQDYHGSMYPAGTQYYRPDRASHAARVCYDDFLQHGLVEVPIVPAGDAIPAPMNAAHAVTGDEIRTWARTWKELSGGGKLGGQGALWWVWEYMTEEMWRAVGDVTFDQEDDEMGGAGYRHNAVAIWFTDRILEPGPYENGIKDAVWQMRSDFGLPPEAKWVEIELFLGSAGGGDTAGVALFDGGTPDGSNDGYAGQVTMREGGHGTITVKLDDAGTCRARYPLRLKTKTVGCLRWWPAEAPIPVR